MLTLTVLIIEDIVMGNMPKPMLIKKDSHGEMNVEEVKGAEAQILTIERVRELTRLDPHNDSR